MPSSAPKIPFVPNDSVPLVQVKRILVVKFRHFGDVLLATPVFSVLQRESPEAQIDALVYADCEPILQGHPAINNIHVVGRQWKKLGLVQRIKHEWRLLSFIRQQNYDLVINLTEGDRGAIVASYSGAKWRVGWQDPLARSFFANYLAYTHRYRTSSKQRHMVEQNLDAVRRLGVRIPLGSGRLSYAIPDDAHQRAQEKLRQAGWQGQPYVVCAPASRWLFKCLEEKTVADALSQLAADGLSIVMVCGPDAVEQNMVRSIMAQVPSGIINLGGQLDLKELGAVVQQAQAFCGTDSLTMHMAAALDIPTVAWFGPSSDIVWSPWQVKQHILSTDLRCRPCGFDGCGGGKRSECLMQIDAKKIAQAIMVLVKSE